MKTRTAEGVPCEELPQGLYVLKLLARAEGFADTPELDAALEAFALESLRVDGADVVASDTPAEESARLMRRAVRVVTAHLELLGFEREASDG